MKTLYLLLLTMALYASPLLAFTHGNDANEYHDIILSFYSNHIASALEEDNIVQEIESHIESYAGIPLSNYALLEKQWQTELEQGNYSLLPNVLTNKAALTASRIKEKAKGVINSIAFVDLNGLNVAQSNVTHSYWHSDYQQWFNNGNPWFSHVDYNNVSDKFIVRVAFPIKAENQETIGFSLVDFDALELEYIKENMHWFNQKENNR